MAQTQSQNDSNPGPATTQTTKTEGVLINAGNVTGYNYSSFPVLVITPQQFGTFTPDAQDTATMVVNAATLSAALLYLSQQTFTPSLNIPAGNYYFTPSVATPGLTMFNYVGVSQNAPRISGSGKNATVLNFVPNANNQIFFSFKYTGANPLIGGCIEHLRLATSDNTYSKVLLKLIDCAETTLENFATAMVTQTALDSVGVHVLGREALRIMNSELRGSVPLRIGANPNNAQYDADLLSCTNTLFYCAGTTSALTSAPVLLDANTVISDVNFKGCDFIGAFLNGFYFASDGSGLGNFGLSFDTCRSEGMTASVSTYSVYVSMTSSNPMTTMTMRNCNWVGTNGGVYTNYVNNIALDTMDFGQTGTTPIMNVNNAQSMTWRNVYTPASTTAPLTLDSSLRMSWAAPTQGTFSQPTNAVWVNNPAALYNPRPTREMSAHKWYWAGTIANGASINLPINSNNMNWAFARIEAQAVASVPGAPISISGAGVLTIGAVYTITALGSSTTPNFASMGFTGTTAAVGDIFIATATGSGTGTGTVTANAFAFGTWLCAPVNQILAGGSTGQIAAAGTAGGAITLYGGISAPQVPSCLAGVATLGPNTSCLWLSTDGTNTTPFTAGVYLNNSLGWSAYVSIEVSGYRTVNN